MAFLSVACGSYEAVRSSYETIKNKQIDVNLLMVLAAIGAILVDRVSDAAALLFLFSLSTTLESIAMARTRSAIEGLVKLRPLTAWKITENVAEEVRVESLEIGDTIRILAYESVPADAVIVEGQSKIDQSAMTGESVPVSCRIGDSVVGGTQNLDGMLLASVTAKVGDSALDRIVELVKNAQDNKASGERISHWFGQTYTIFVVIAFLISLAIRYVLHEKFGEAFYLSLTLLVGLSPCALVISTPATTLSALAWCARNGILVRGGEFIERVGQVTALALDKTGTLTWGRPVLQGIAFAETSSIQALSWRQGDPFPKDLVSILMSAASVEEFSTHPIAHAILEQARTVGSTLPANTDHQVVSGLGVRATVDGCPVLVGRESFLEAEGLLIPDPLKASMKAFQLEGFTVSLVSTKEGISVFALSDSIRTEAGTFIQRLRQIGVNKVIMLTGDRLESAQAVAQQLDISEVKAGLLPGEKTEYIQKLMAKEKVMMVGDGVNDAPSLASASVGVAMGGLGSDIAMNAADIVLMHDHIERIPELILLGRSTNSTIKVNLLFAGAMIIALTVSSLIIRLPLPVAVVGHEGSTVLVILNGLRMLKGPGK